jgi:hypothetical protein
MKPRTSRTKVSVLPQAGSLIALLALRAELAYLPSPTWALEGALETLRTRATPTGPLHTAIGQLPPAPLGPDERVAGIRRLVKELVAKGCLTPVGSGWDARFLPDHAWVESHRSLYAAALGEDGHLAAKPLIDALLAAGWLDSLPAELRGGFASQVMLALPWMRNHLGGHGQGRDELPLPEPYARLALGLAAAFNEFIVGLAIERDPSLVRVTDQRPLLAKPLTKANFASVSGADDDIPF